MYYVWIQKYGYGSIFYYEKLYVFYIVILCTFYYCKINCVVIIIPYNIYIYISYTQYVL